MAFKLTVVLAFFAIIYGVQASPVLPLLPGLPVDKLPLDTVTNVVTGVPVVGSAVGPVLSELGGGAGFDDATIDENTDTTTTSSGLAGGLPLLSNLDIIQMLVSLISSLLTTLPLAGGLPALPLP